MGTRYCRRVVPCPRRAPPARLRSRSVTKPGGRGRRPGCPAAGQPFGTADPPPFDMSQALLLKDDEGVGSEAQGVPPTAVPQGKTGSRGEPRRRKTGCEKWGKSISFDTLGVAQNSPGAVSLLRDVPLWRWRRRELEKSDRLAPEPRPGVRVSCHATPSLPPSAEPPPQGLPLGARHDLLPAVGNPKPLPSGLYPLPTGSLLKWGAQRQPRPGVTAGEGM